MINIYSREDCPPCRTLKKYLTHRGIEYNVLDLDENPSLAQRVIELTGFMQIPTVETEKGVVSGLNIPAIFSIIQ